MKSTFTKRADRGRRSQTNVSLSERRGQTCLDYAERQETKVEYQGNITNVYLRIARPIVVLFFLNVSYEKDTYGTAPCHFPSRPKVYACPPILV